MAQNALPQASEGISRGVVRGGLYRGLIKRWLYGSLVDWFVLTGCLYRLSSATARITDKLKAGEVCVCLDHFLIMTYC